MITESRPASLLLVAGAMAALVLLLACPHQQPPTVPLALFGHPPPPPSPQAILESLPLVFVPNQGQWDPGCLFMADRGHLVVRLEASAIRLAVQKIEGDHRRGCSIGLGFEGARPDAAVYGEEPLRATRNYFLGNDPARWASSVPTYSRVLYQGIYAGIDLRLREGSGGLEYDLLLDPETDVDQVVIRTEGVESLRLDGDGSLVMETTVGPIRQKPPTTWQETPDGERQPLGCRYRLLDDRCYGFTAPERELGLAMVIDPGLEWSTFIGGSGNDAVAVFHQNDSGVVTVAGWTCSSLLPLVNPFDTSMVWSNPNQPCEAFVCQLDPNLSGPNQMLWFSYLGGSGSDRPNGISVDPTSGVVTVAGRTDSSDFPMPQAPYSPPFQATNAGGWDGFIVKLDPSQTGASQIIAGTYLGGLNSDSVVPLAVAPSGEVTVAGWTLSSEISFPVTSNAYDATYNGGSTLSIGDAFVARLDSTLSVLSYCTYFGGSGDELAFDMKVDASGQVFFCGRTTSANLPTTSIASTGPWDPSFNGAEDAYVARLDPSLGGSAQLLYATYLGGTGYDQPNAMDLDALGQVTLGGWTNSTGFPVTPNAYQSAKNAGYDVFIARLDADGSTILWSTFVGGGGDEGVNGLNVDSGLVTATGSVASADFPTTQGAFDTSFNSGCGYFGCYDAFVVRLDPNLSGVAQLVYSTYLGGSAGYDYGYFSVALDATDAATVGGLTSASDFPTTAGAYDVTWNGYDDGFVTRLDMHPTGVEKYGASTPSCLGHLAMGTSRMPLAGDPLFSVTCTGAPPSATGLFALSLGQQVPGIAWSGIVVHVDLTPGQWAYVMTSSDTVGYAQVSLPIPPGIQGFQVFGQFAFANPPGCGVAGALCASNALALTVQ